MTENKQNFLQWYARFIQKKRVKGLNNPEKWFDQMQEAHIELRKSIGGVRKTLIIAVGDEVKPVPLSEASDCIRTILRYLPNYFQHYGLSERNLLSAKMEVYGREYSTSKHILTYAQQLGLSEENMKILQQTLADFGKLWAAQRTVKKNYRAVISTSCRSFAALGHCRVDRSSCFGSFNSDKKYCIGIHPNSFILYIRNKGTQLRILCFLVDNSLILSNGYNNGIPEGNVQSVVQTVAEFLNLKEHTIASGTGGKIIFAGGINYNSSSQYIVSSKEKPLQNITLNFSTEYSLEFHPDRDEYANR